MQRAGKVESITLRTVRKNLKRERARERKREEEKEQPLIQVQEAEDEITLRIELVRLVSWLLLLRRITQPYDDLIHRPLQRQEERKIHLEFAQLPCQQLAQVSPSSLAFFSLPSCLFLSLAFCPEAER